jgi:hypothetical protein
MKIKCIHCDGAGAIHKCVSEVDIDTISPRHTDEIQELKTDAIKCKADHEKLCTMNPRAKESYDSQLAETLTKINERADEILKRD